MLTEKKRNLLPPPIAQFYLEIGSPKQIFNKVGYIYGVPHHMLSWKYEFNLQAAR
jgi:hypothetical protein